MTSEVNCVAITGGSGFIGTHLVNRLLASQIRIRVLTRHPDRVSTKHPLLEVISGELGNSHALDELVRDTSHVIHCAGRVRGHTKQQFHADNVMGTQHLLDSCARVGTLNKLVFISSLAAREPSISYYAISKHRAENLIKNNNHTPWSIIRPPAVYGPNDKELTPLFDWMKRGVAWVPGNYAQTLSLLHVHDLVELIIQQVLSPACHHTLEPDDGQHYDWPQITQLSSEFFQHKVRKIVIPKGALLSVAKLNVILSRLINYSPMLTPGKVRELTHLDWCACGVEPSLGWSAQIDLKKGLGTLYSTP